VVEALTAAAHDPSVHGYSAIRGLARTKEAIAGRYRDVYGVDLDPEREVALVPGTKTAIVELAMALADEGDTILLPDPYYPDYPSGLALAGARLQTVPLVPEASWAPDLDAAPSAAALLLNYPSNPCAVCAPAGTFDAAVRWAGRTGGHVVHDAAYTDLVFDGRKPQSFLATPGAKDVGVEMWTMSKTYGMAGWRIGFVLGNAEVVERLNLFNDHSRVGIFAPLQAAAVAALEGPQTSVAARVATYQARRDRLAAALPVPIVCEGTFYVWLRLPEGLTADRLLVEDRVAVAPGEGFGPSGAGWVRLSLAVTDAAIDEAADRLARSLAGAPA
jgi:aminotransferase